MDNEEETNSREKKKTLSRESLIIVTPFCAD